MKIELLGVKYYFHRNKTYLISTNYECGYKEEEQLIFIENWTKDMKEYKGKVFHSQEEVLALCDTIVNSEGWSYPTFIYDCVVKITEGSNISYKLYRRTIGYYYFDSIEKYIEIISFGVYSKGFFVIYYIVILKNSFN